MDFADARFKAYVLEDVTMNLDNGEAWPAMKKKLKTKGVEVVMMNAPKVGRVRALGRKEGN